MEFDLTSHNFQGDFKWTTNFNIAYNQNVVTDVGGLPPDAFDNRSGGDARVIEGYAVGIAFLVEWAGVQQEDGQIGLWNTDGTAVTDGEVNQVMADVAAGTELYYDLNGNLRLLQILRRIFMAITANFWLSFSKNCWWDK